MLIKNSYCTYCGDKYTDETWPRFCTNCKNHVWRNPLPVTVVMCAVYDFDNYSKYGFGLVLVRRSIEPHIGELALPGGYLDIGETTEAGAARELYEETGIKVESKYVMVKKLITAPSNSNLLIFTSVMVSSKDVPTFVPNNEVSEMIIATAPMELAFPTHTEMMKEFFEGLSK